MTQHRRTLGQRAEKLAAAFLETLGLKLEARNVRLKSGEIDIVASTGKTLVFVEVRSRSSQDGVSPLDSIGAKKRRRLRRVVTDYLNHFDVGPDWSVRIDVVGVTWLPNSVHIEYLPDAV